MGYQATVVLVSFPGDTEERLCQELSGPKCSGKHREALGMALEAGSITFFRRGLSVSKTISSTHSDLRFGGPPGSGHGVRLGSMEGTDAHKRDSRHVQVCQELPISFRQWDIQVKYM